MERVTLLTLPHTGPEETLHATPPPTTKHTVWERLEVTPVSAVGRCLRSRDCSPSTLMDTGRVKLGRAIRGLTPEQKAKDRLG